MASRYRGVIKIKTMKDKTISASLIYRKIEGKLSAVEEERFEAWLKEGWEHREYYAVSYTHLTLPTICSV